MQRGLALARPTPKDAIVVVTRYSGGDGYYSTDGVNFSTFTQPILNPRGVKWLPDLNQWVMSKQQQFWQSTSIFGSWTQNTSPAPGFAGTAWDFGYDPTLDRIVCVGDTGLAGYYKPDGSTPVFSQINASGSTNVQIATNGSAALTGTLSGPYTTPNAGAAWSATTTSFPAGGASGVAYAPTWSRPYYATPSTSSSVRRVYNWTGSGSWAADTSSPLTNTVFSRLAYSPTLDTMIATAENPSTPSAVGIYYKVGNAGPWTAVTSVPSLSGSGWNNAIWSPAANAFYAMTGNRLYRSADGITWTFVSSVDAASLYGLGVK